jgi:hypothetical protein
VAVERATLVVGACSTHERAAASAPVLLIVFCFPGHGRDQIHTLLVIDTRLAAQSVPAVTTEVHPAELVSALT